MGPKRFQRQNWTEAVTRFKKHFINRYINSCVLFFCTTSSIVTSRLLAVCLYTYLLHRKRYWTSDFQSVNHYDFNCRCASWFCNKRKKIVEFVSLFRHILKICLLWHRDDQNSKGWRSSVARGMPPLWPKEKNALSSHLRSLLAVTQVSNNF